MSKKIKNKELLVAEIHTIQSKMRSLKNQYKANEEKLARLQATQDQIKAKYSNLEAQLGRDMTLADNNQIPY